MTILVCGDAMIDRYWMGEVSRISPEAPVPVVKVIRTEEREGGAANVANNVAAMGAECRRLFSPSKEQVVKIRIIGRNQQVVRADFDNRQEPINLPAFDMAQYGCDFVVFSDYGKGALADIGKLIVLAKTANKTVLVDPKGHDYERYRWADVVKPNLDEMKELVGGWSGEAELTKKAESLRIRADIGAILLTRSARGMTLYNGDGVHHIEAEPREIYDVSGAGDTAIAALAVALSEGMALKAAASVANRAAGVAVERFGTAVITREEAFGAIPA